MDPRSRLAASRAGIALVIAATSGLHCNSIQEAIEEEAEERAREQAGAGNPGDNSGPSPDADAISVNSLAPSSGSIEGGQLVEVIGSGFEPGFEVSFGGATVPLADIQWQDANTILVLRHPPFGGVGPVDIAVRRPGSDEAGVLPAGFRYFRAPRLTSVSPSRGPTSGGSTITLTGQGFVEGTEVILGADTQAEATLIDETTLQAITPELPIGFLSIAVRNVNGSATLPDAYQTFSPVRLNEIRPVVGDTAGGTNLLVVGTGFVPESRVTVGDVEYAQALNNVRETELSVIAGPGAEGAVDVGVENGNGSDALKDAFVYVNFSDPGSRIVAVTPSSDLVEGGREVSVVGVGFDDPSLDVFFGAARADCVLQSTRLIRCIAPPGIGTVDVEVVSNSGTLRLKDSFTYVPLAIDAMVDDRGAIAGGTYVKLYGDGFDEDIEVLLDGEPARDIVALSTTQLTFRTPPGNPGPAEVRIESRGVARSRPELFTYFDPADEVLWTSGGPIDGTVNITVIDSVSDLPLADAFVMLGSEAEPLYSGTTNARGQITFSGPDVLGPLTVTAAKTDFAAFSYVDVNAQNLRLLTIGIPPPSEPSPGGGGGEAVEPPVIRGTVLRVKDQFNADDDVVRVTTSAALLGFPLPDPGLEAELINNGDYQLVSRDGDLVVIALVGTPDPDTGRFQVKTMGFAGPLAVENGRVYDGIDIRVDTPLDTDLVLSFDDAPVASRVDPDYPGDSPDTAQARVYYDFGSAGVHQMAELRRTGTTVLSIPMPRFLPTPLTSTPFVIDAGVYLGVPNSFDPERPTLDFPFSTFAVGPRVDSREPVSVGPLLGVLDNVSPQDSDTVGRDEPLRIETIVNQPLPAATANVLRLERSTDFSRVTEWFIVTAGTSNVAVLPPPAIPGLGVPEGSYTMRMQRYRVEGAGFNQLDLEGLLRADAAAQHFALFELE